jgi:hypothetical protein
MMNQKNNFDRYEIDLIKLLDKFDKNTNDRIKQMLTEITTFKKTIFSYYKPFKDCYNHLKFQLHYEQINNFLSKNFDFCKLYGVNLIFIAFNP